MKIACVGCSWTEGSFHNFQLGSGYVDHYGTYPYILQKWLSEKNLQSTVYNCGRAGSSVYFNPFTCDYILKTFNPDVFILQLTTFDRSFMKLDPLLPKDKQMQWGYDEINKSYYKVWDNNVNMIHLTLGMSWIGARTSNNITRQANVDKKLFKHVPDGLVEKIWKDRIKGKIVPEISLAEFSDYVCTWYEQEANDLNYAPYEYYNSIYSLVDQLQALGKSVIPFYWLNHLPKLKTNLFPVRQFPIVEKLFDSKTFKELQIDNGYHFGKQGNTRLVQEFLGPQVLEITK